MALDPHLVYTGEYTIRTYEIDRHKKATVVSLVKLMQEAAMQNVITMGVSVWDMEKHKISWVLMRKHLEINRLPKLGETIKVITHPAGFEKFFTYRDYKVLDQDDKIIAQSSSTWLLMDTEKRRMARIPDFILALEPPKTETYLPRPVGKVPKIDRVDEQQDFLVQWHHLDFNEHLSNTYYIQWMLETVDDEVLNNAKLHTLDLQYKAESLWKDELVAECQKIDESTFLHKLLRKSDKQELAIAKSQWTL
ncbi:MAG: hypothetical protein GY810_05035 [Aureispira sp.]|nr:hypothetical protein [Aureispira sp.]